MNAPLEQVRRAQRVSKEDLTELGRSLDHTELTRIVEHSIREVEDLVCHDASVELQGDVLRVLGILLKARVYLANALERAEAAE